ncbi:MAG: hypothetical protein IIZ92_00135 [Aquincola sp.]|nr:hypothetical protein [Aquincola sp.]
MKKQAQLPIAVTVRYAAGAYNTGRVAGKSASSTMDARTAVERLADKLSLAAPIVVSHPKDPMQWLIVPRGWQPPAGTPCVLLQFEDQGQDFLQWWVEPTTGLVFDCRPFQASLWCYRRVFGDVRQLVPGQRVRLEDQEAGKSIKYPLVSVIAGEAP